MTCSYDVIGPLTSLAVIPSVPWCWAKMQKMVTPSLTRSMDSETDGHAMVITVALRCGESVVKLTIHGGISISHALCLPCHLALIDTISCSDCCMLTFNCLIGHSIVISRRPTMRDTDTGSQQAALLTYCFWNRNLVRIVGTRRLSNWTVQYTGWFSLLLKVFKSLKKHQSYSWKPSGWFLRITM